MEGKAGQCRAGQDRTRQCGIGQGRSEKEKSMTNFGTWQSIGQSRG